jgi:hypothetical protein
MKGNRNLQKTNPAMSKVNQERKPQGTTKKKQITSEDTMYMDMMCHYFYFF